MNICGRTLTLGCPDESQVVFVARERNADCEIASEHVKDARVKWFRDDDGAHIIGRGERGEIRFVRGGFASQPLLDFLRGIEKYEAGREDVTGLCAIFGAILASEMGTASGQNTVIGAPAFFAHLAEERTESIDESWSEQILEENGAHFIEELVTNRKLSKPIAGPLDSARFWIKVGERLWDPEVRSRLSSVQPDGRTKRILVMITGAWMDLKQEGWVKVAGTGFRLEGGSKKGAWPQVMEWEGGKISRSALKYLTGYRRDYPFDGMLAGLMGGGGEDFTKPKTDPVLAAHESRRLLEDAALQWTCDPYGSFRVDIPDMTPLRSWDVTSLRVWITPGEGLWVALEKDDQPGVSFRWTAAPPHLRRWVMQEDAIPAIHLTLSALWRDLKIGGRDVMLQEGDDVRSNGDKEKKSIRLHGRINWGSKEELDRIIREAYQVEDHIRVLPHGMRASRRATRWAMGRGIILKPGTTYVRRHNRGNPDEGVENVPVKAQGLARLILAHKQESFVQMRVSSR